MSCPRLHLDERHCSARPFALGSGRNQINIAVAILEPALGDLPTVDMKPPRRDLLAFESHCLLRR
jgi:hypothetical protein